MAQDSILLYDYRLSKDFIDSIVASIEKLSSSTPKREVFKKTKRDFQPNSIIFLLILDSDFLKWLPTIANLDCTLIILPYRDNPLQQAEYLIPNEIEKALELAFTKTPKTISSYICLDNKMAMGCITVGSNSWLEQNSFKNIFSMRLSGIDIKTAKEQEIKTVALMVEVGSELLLNKKRSYFFKASDNQCQRVSAIIYAPQSIIDAIKLRLFLAKKIREEADSLPLGIGTIKANSITLSSLSDKPFSVIFNSKRASYKELTIKSKEIKAKIVTGDSNCIKADDKESIRVKNLPVDSESISFFSKRVLPLVPIANEDAFAELFKKLREVAKIQRAYLTLLLISILMATIGLFQNSSPTIIGAMILAPLMGPIIALAMGAIRFDNALIKNSVKTILFSIALGLIISALIASSIPFSHLTEQMITRTHPTLLDLGVAILAGVAASYGYANSKVGESLAGVAIAVALVPPLCVSGIGIGWASWHIFYNAFLLFMANIVGIIIASGVMFYLMGYASRKYASTAFFIKLLMVGVVTIPLWLSTRSLIAKESIYTKFAQIEQIELDNKTVKINLVRVAQDKEGYYAIVTVSSNSSLTPKEKALLAKRIKSKISKDIKLIFTFREVF